MPARTAPLPQRRTGVPQVVRRAVHARADGCCERCRVRLPWPEWHCHHRKLRSQGGADDPTNLLALCWRCHRSVHDHPADSYREGWLVRSHRVPAAVPLWRGGCWWRLTDDRWETTA